MKPKILILAMMSFILLLISFSDSQAQMRKITENKILINETVTATNDTLIPEWTELKGSQLELFMQGTDSVNMYIYVDYRSGGFSSYNTVAVDSCKGLTNSGAIKTMILRGYGTSAIVNLIPGCTYFRPRAIRKTGTGYRVPFKLSAVQRE